jgi:hypothetical protein
MTVSLSNKEGLKSFKLKCGHSDLFIKIKNLFELDEINLRLIQCHEVIFLQFFHLYLMFLI